MSLGPELYKSKETSFLKLLEYIYLWIFSFLLPQWPSCRRNTLWCLGHMSDWAEQVLDILPYLSKQSITLIWKQNIPGDLLNQIVIFDSMFNFYAIHSWWKSTNPLILKSICSSCLASLQIHPKTLHK